VGATAGVVLSTLASSASELVDGADHIMLKGKKTRKGEVFEI
jgi:hypothetical protein